MTTKDKVELLVRIGVWEDFKKAWTETHGPERPMISHLKQVTAPLLISSAFRWAMTSQGHCYWGAAHERLVVLLKGEEGAE